MDQLGEDGQYRYQNRDLGFSISLPPEFEYYQVQRKQTAEFIDIEFFVPTSDLSYPQDVPGYAKPIVVRIFTAKAWQEMGSDEDKIIYQKVKEKGKKIYTIRFWDKIPTDWNNKWSEEMKNTIKSSFKIS